MSGLKESPYFSKPGSVVSINSSDNVGATRQYQRHASTSESVSTSASAALTSSASSATGRQWWKFVTREQSCYPGSHHHSHRAEIGHDDDHDHDHDHHHKRNEFVVTDRTKQEYDESTGRTRN